MFNKILVICVGNICRSPTGAQILQSYLPHKHVASAGISARKSGLVGKGADDAAKLIAQEHGYSLEAHRAQQFTSDLARDYDLILVMEKKHIDAVCSIAPEARGKTLLFGQWIGQKDIPDPYGQSREAFVHVYELIQLASKAWLSKL